MEWRAAFSKMSGQIVITRPSGKPLYFQAVAGSSKTRRAGGTGTMSSLVELLGADLSPCTTGAPAWLRLVMEDETSLLFSVETGRVESMTTKAGAVVSRQEFEADIRIERDLFTGEILSFWSRYDGLLLPEHRMDGMRLCWYAAADLPDEGLSGLERSALPEPVKVWELRTTLQGEEKVTVIRSRRAGQPEMVVERRTRGNDITIIRGEGEEQVVKTIVRRPLQHNRWEYITTLKRPSDAAPASCVRELLELTEGGWLTLEKTEGYGSVAPRTTTYSYVDSRPVLTVYPEGGYLRQGYDSEGREIFSAAPSAHGGEKRTRTQYADLAFNDFRPAVVTESMTTESGEEVIQRITRYRYEETAGSRMTTVTVECPGDASRRVSVSEFYSDSPGTGQCSRARGRLKYSRGEDGVETWYSYESASEYGSVCREVAETRVAGAVVPARSRRTVHYMSPNGNVACTEKYAHTGSDSWALLSRELYEYDEKGRVVSTVRANGRNSTSEWSCCGPLRQVDGDGIVLLYSYNSARQLVETIRSATQTGVEIITSLTLDAAGRTLSLRRDEGPMTTVAHTVYDAVGRVVSETDVMGRVTTHSYDVKGLRQTTLLPTGATLVTQRHADGSLLWEGGTGRQERSWTYEPTTRGMLTTESVKTGEVWTPVSQTLVNGLGQTIESSRANTLGGWVTTVLSYNGRGQLVEERTGEQAPILYEYDALGELSRKIVKMQEGPTPLDSPVKAVTRFHECREEGVYDVTVTTTYNDRGVPLVQTEAVDITGLSSSRESCRELTDIYGNTDRNWTTYGPDSQRMVYASSPFSELEAYSVMEDGRTLAQLDFHRIYTTRTRLFTASGFTVEEVDGRGNTSITQYNVAGQPVKVTDAGGGVTTIRYDLATGKPDLITNAEGGTTCYAYDHRGRKTAEYGTAVQPVLYAYDEADRLVALTTFRATRQIISDNPAFRTDGDTTSWRYDPATGLLKRKEYADGSSLVYEYDASNQLVSQVNARGIVTTHEYHPLTGALLSTTHSDGTPGVRYVYDHLGNLREMEDASGTTAFAYDAYGKLCGESFGTGLYQYTLAQSTDGRGRLAGYSLSRGEEGELPLSVKLVYNGEGRVASLDFLQENQRKTIDFSYLAGSNSIKSVKLPNGVLKSIEFEPLRDLPVRITHTLGDMLLIDKTQTSDTLARPVARTGRRVMSPGSTLAGPQDELAESFGYNLRGELESASVNGRGYSFFHDNIGNREGALGEGSMTIYATNRLNQYDSVSPRPGSPFRPEYDADGSQTLLRTSTGDWRVEYDANNRPVRFSQPGTEVYCEYDARGRRFARRVVRDGQTVSHLRYLYRGYLQIAALDLLNDGKLVYTLLWDPTEETATRPVAMVRNGEAYYYAHDFNKNVTEIFDGQGAIKAAYEYEPFGAVTVHDPDALGNPVQWSSEMHDEELGLVYYNYRHYNPLDGRWISRDLIQEMGGVNLYLFVKNKSIFKIDALGLFDFLSMQIHDNFDLYINLLKILNDKYNEMQDMLRVDKEEGIKACEKYKKTKCCKKGIDIDDPYIDEAKNMCKKFVEKYSVDNKVIPAVKCVANCLVNNETIVQKEKKCEQRNALRLEAHFSCYVRCGFFLTSSSAWGVPEGGWEIGLYDLLPDWIISKIDFIKQYIR